MTDYNNVKPYLQREPINTILYIACFIAVLFFINAVAKYLGLEW